MAVTLTYFRCGARYYDNRKILRCTIPNIVVIWSGNLMLFLWLAAVRSVSARHSTPPFCLFYCTVRFLFGSVFPFFSAQYRPFGALGKTAQIVWLSIISARLIAGWASFRIRHCFHLRFCQGQEAQIKRQFRNYFLSFGKCLLIL